MLLENGIIRNSKHGYIDKNYNHVGYYRTCGGNRYIEDKYVP